MEFTTLPEEQIQHHFVEIRDARRGHKLITLVEILSPSNKRPGPDRDSYSAKQREVFATDANLVEIDLQRSGRRIFPTPELGAAVARLEPPPDYLVLVSRSWRRIAPLLGYCAYPVSLRDRLPCIGIPLIREGPEVPLDLQFSFQRTYEGGPYRRGESIILRRFDPLFHRKMPPGPMASCTSKAGTEIGNSRPCPPWCAAPAGREIPRRLSNARPQRNVGERYRAPRGEATGSIIWDSSRLAVSLRRARPLPASAARRRRSAP